MTLRYPVLHPHQVGVLFPNCEASGHGIHSATALNVICERPTLTLAEELRPRRLEPFLHFVEMDMLGGGMDASESTTGLGLSFL